MKKVLVLGSAALSIVLMQACDGGKSITSSNVVYASDSGATSGEVLAKIDGEAISEEDLSKTLEGPDKGKYIKAKTEFYKQQKEVLSDYVFDQLLEKHAKKLGKSKDDLYEAEVSKKIKKVSDQDAKKFYDDLSKQSKGRPGALPEFKVVKDRIVDRIKQEREGERREEFFNELTHKYKVTYYLSPPRMDVATGENPVKGNKNAPVTIVEFSDFECPFCKRGYEAIDEVAKKYKGKVQVYFRDFPLSFHKKAKMAANAVRCAGDQDKFWAMHDEMFEDQRAWASKKDEAEAKAEVIKIGTNKVGVKKEAFEKCVNNNTYYSQIDADMKAGAEAGVSGTPAFFINGIPLSGALPFAEFKKVIDEELSRMNSQKG